jgi:hypothetical protein
LKEPKACKHPSLEVNIDPEKKTKQTTRDYLLVQIDKCSQWATASVHSHHSKNTGSDHVAEAGHDLPR